MSTCASIKGFNGSIRLSSLIDTIHLFSTSLLDPALTHSLWGKRAKPFLPSLLINLIPWLLQDTEELKSNHVVGKLASWGQKQKYWFMCGKYGQGKKRSGMKSVGSWWLISKVRNVLDTSGICTVLDFSPLFKNAYVLLCVYYDVSERVSPCVWTHTHARLYLSAWSEENLGELVPSFQVELWGSGLWSKDFYLLNHLTTCLISCSAKFSFPRFSPHLHAWVDRHSFSRAFSGSCLFEDSHV